MSRSHRTTRLLQNLPANRQSQDEQQILAQVSFCVLLLALINEVMKEPGCRNTRLFSHCVSRISSFVSMIYG